MKSFRFNAIWLLAPQSQRARAVRFHPHKNMIVGRNHTGKSTLIKHLFSTLGADPTGRLQNWDDSAISVVAFSVDTNEYRAIHQSGHRALFSNGQLIAAASSRSDWSAAFAGATGFNLVLTDRSLTTVAADPRCFFLPFYINQNGSWQSQWDTFVGLQQFKSPTGAILEYFSGVKPPEYYDLESRRTQAEHALAELEKERIFLDRARERFAKSMSSTGPKVDPTNFTQDIDRLTAEVTELNQRQEVLRDQAVREREMLANIRLQIKLADDALHTYDRDATYLRGGPPEVLACPTCGAEHAKSFLDLLTFAEDARVLRELVLGLHNDARKAEDQCRITEDKLRELQANYGRVSAILEVRRGDLKFGDVVSSMGAEEAFRAFEQEAAALRSDIGQWRETISGLSARLKQLTNPERSREILSKFRDAYASSLDRLKLPPINTSKLRLTSRPDLSGSGGPRSVLAYYAALWTVCRGTYGSFSLPLVIDAPQQQGQDDINLPNILSFIANDLSSHAQVILGIEMITGLPFDSRIELDEPYHLLRAEDYSEAQSVVEPLAKAMFDELRRTSSSETT